MSIDLSFLHDTYSWVLLCLIVLPGVCLVTYTRGSSQVRASEVKLPSTRQPSSFIPKRLKAADHINDGKVHLLLCATGSVATIKIPNIIWALAIHQNLSIRLVFTKSAQEFLQAQADEQPSIDTIASYKNVDGVYFDMDEWQKPWVRGDEILHIELRRWADVMAIVPLSANSLAKVSLGLSDNLVTSVLRAWDTTGIIDLPRPATEHLRERYNKKLVLLAPAMNTAMWEHPVTTRHLSALKPWTVEHGGWIEILSPIQKNLACGDTGSGAMMNWEDIVRVIEQRLVLREDGDDTLSNMKR